MVFYVSDTNGHVNHNSEMFKKIFFHRFRYFSGLLFWGEIKKTALSANFCPCKVLYRSPKNMICPRYPHDMAKIGPRYSQNMPKIYSTYAYHMPKICQRYISDMPNICPRYAKYMPKICLRYADSIWSNIRQSKHLKGRLGPPLVISVCWVCETLGHWPALA